MALNTCSEGISFVREMEEASAALYEEMAKLFPESAEKLQEYAKSNNKNVANVQRTYFGVITDGIEGCYAFNLEPELYAIDATLPAGVSKADALAKAIAVEETMARFYADAGEQGKGLTADVARAFTMISRKKGERVEELKALCK